MSVVCNNAWMDFSLSVVHLGTAMNQLGLTLKGQILRPLRD